MHKHLQDIKTSKMLFFLCWFAYAAAYVGRISYYTALTGMINDCGFAKSEAGLIGTAFFFVYGCGQILSGILGDRVSPFKMILTGLTLSAAANFCIGFCRNYLVMTVIWGFNGLAQSLLWSPILFIFIHVLHPDLRNKACLYITSSVPAGTVVTYLISYVLLKYSHWNSIFLLGSVVLFAAAGIWLFASLICSRRLVEETPDAVPQNCVEKPDARPSRNLFWLLSMSGAATMLLAILIHGMLKEGVSVWVPTMISETYHVSSSFSVFLSTLLPVISIIGPYAIDYFYRGKLKGDEVRAATVCLFSAIPVFCALFFIGTLPVAACIAMLALISAIMNAFNYITVTMIPVRFSRYHKAATATGLLNSITYIGSALSTYGFGYLSEQFGWKYTVVFWIGITVVGIVACFCSFRRWRKFITPVSN